MGDRTNFVLMFAGELLKKAENLLLMGLHPSEIVTGYEMARDKAEEELSSKISYHLFAQCTSKYRTNCLSLNSFQEQHHPPTSHCGITGDATAVSLSS